jgi:hypothetical protein
MLLLPLVFGVLLQPQAAEKQAEPRLDARAERGIGGVQSDGWQHISLRLENPSGQPITGRATLYEYESQVGARPRNVLPFAVDVRQVLHFYPFRPPETAQPSTYLITLEDDSGRPILYDGASQFVIGGRSTRALRVEMGDAPNGDFRIGLWGETNPFMRTLINEWNPSPDEIYRMTQGRLAARQFMTRGGMNRMNPEVVPIEQPKLLPDSFVGFGELDALIALGVDTDTITERQRRALADWVHSGGLLVFVPAKKEHLTGPFMRDLIGVADRGEVTTADDRHLMVKSDAGPSHQIVHFLTAVDSSRPMEVAATYEGMPVVYSVPAGFGRIWVVGFIPESHGGLRRFQSLWLSILNQSLKYRIVDGPPPTSLAARTWSAESDDTWLKRLSDRFGKSPAVDSLAILIFGYLLVVGPANFFVLKRREARVLLIATVPVLALLFGGAVLAMGYVSHGLRAATNQIGLAIATPDGDRAFVEEYVAVYGTTSAEYRLGFPKNLPVRPLGEFIASPSGTGFENPSSFKLAAREERSWLEDWRLTFWQTRGTASIDCVLLGGKLSASSRGAKLTVSNQTGIAFNELIVVAGGQRSLGLFKPFESREFEIDLLADPQTDPTSRERESIYDRRAMETKVAVQKQASGASPSANPTVEASDSPITPDDLDWPEARALVQNAAGRLNQQNRNWIFGLTRQPIHPIESPDAKRHLVTSLYAWPIVQDPKSNSAAGTD